MATDDPFDLADALGLTGDQYNAVGGAVKGLGTGIGDLMTAEGSFQAEGGYKAAAQYARLEGAIKQESLNRQIYQTVGQNKAATAANGFQLSGSALDVVQQTAQQGGIAKGIAAINTANEVQSYEAQAKAAENAGIGGIIGGGLSLIGGLFGL